MKYRELKYILRFLKMYCIDIENGFQRGCGATVDAYLNTFCFFNSLCFRTSYSNTYTLLSLRFFCPLTKTFIFYQFHSS